MSIVIAVLIFGFLVFFHEGGHFLLARANHVTVTEFSMGFGPRILSRVTKNGTRLSLKLIPFGGSCAMLGEDTDEEDEGAFGSKGVWARISVVFAGPFFNFLLAFFLSVILISLIGYDEPVLSAVREGYPAQTAGLQAGDTILSVNGKRTHTFSDISLELAFVREEPVEITYERDGESNTATLSLKEDTDGGYYLGITSKERTRGNILQNIRYGWYELTYCIRATYKSLGALFTGKASLNDLSGPVGIVSYMGSAYEEAAKISALSVVSSMLSIAILLSANLGVMNLLPLPALDGGRLFFLLLEAVRGKRIDPEKEGKVHFAGMLLLFALMIYVLIHDFYKLL